MNNSLWNIVDVRDVADALLLAYERPEASGRYLCAPYPITIRDLVDLLKGMYPNYGYPKKFVLFPTFYLRSTIDISTSILTLFSFELQYN